VLEQILMRRPASPPELLAIRGIGQAFCDKHGESLLAELEALSVDQDRDVRKSRQDRRSMLMS
jgi:HRDC domain